MKRRTVIRIVSYSLSFCAVALGAAVMGFSQAGEYRRSTKNVHMSAFTQLVSGISKLDAAFEKSICCGTNGMSAVMCAEIWREAAEAKAALSMIPLEYGQLEKTQKFISQSGEYAYTLLKKTADGQSFDNKDIENIKSLRAVSDKLAIELSQAENSLKSGISGKTVGMGQSRGSKNGGSDGEDEQNEDFPEYAELIYDGPFSEHISKKTPQLTQGAKDFNEQQAAARLADILGVKREDIKSDGQSKGKIETYCFSVGNNQAEITKKGGFLLNYTNVDTPADDSITAEQAIAKAKEFLNKCGYDSMTESYYMVSNGIITINFAYKKDGITYYTDLIKVSVFMDGGHIAGLESFGYIMNHKERNLQMPSVSSEKAKESLSKNLSLLSEQMCVVPTKGDNEKLCYEFKTKTDEDKHCIVYIDAQTGTEQNIFILIEDENGTLAV